MIRTARIGWNSCASLIQKSTTHQSKFNTTTVCLTKTILPAICILILSLQSFAQYAKLLDFDNANGGNPLGTLAFDGTFLYGMTDIGGVNNEGTLFKIKTDGTGYTKLLDFKNLTHGKSPKGSVTISGGFLYGMTWAGGANGVGTIFKIKPDGTGYTKLLDFNGTNGSYPFGSLTSDGTFLYGMTTSGGTNNQGVIFKILPSGTGYAKLLDFTGLTNGSNPLGSLFYEGTFLYGMTSMGGANALGTIFRIKPDGTGYAKIFDFTGAASGAKPDGDGSLISDGTFLYGVANSGGSSNFGTIFKILPDGSGFTKLLDFTGAANGRLPHNHLVFDGAFLYGVTTGGGISNFGTIFKIPPDGNGYFKLLDFDGAEGGRYPIASIIYNGSFLYGMTPTGGTNNLGIVYKYSLIPPTITSFTPTNGSIGASVVITGTNFSATPANNIVKFNGILATVTASTATSITTNVPTSATTGAITVTVAGNTATSASNFTLIPVATIAITTQPSASTVCNGTTAMFTAAATGTTNITYQWQFSTTLAGIYADTSNASGYSSVATPSLSINTAGNFGAGFYRCKVNGDFATAVFTNAGQLTINPIPAAPSATGASACSGASTTLTASGGINGQYRWYTVATGGTVVAGETNSTYATPSLSITTNYYVSIVNSNCESVRTQVTATIGGIACNNQPPVINAISLSVSAQGTTTISLFPLISDADNNLDINSLKIKVPPISDALASINQGILTINYAGTNFLGTDNITIEVCDLVGSCAQQQLIIEVTGNIVVYNAVSPEGKNPILHISAIEGLSSKVSIYNRWGDEVFSISDYDNKTRAFSGVTNDGSKLPTGTYFYKIILPTTNKTLTGFLSLKY
jgi:uncharacterized repeat protein (TIGR03803 family)